MAIRSRSACPPSCAGGADPDRGLRALKDGAPTRPALCGALAGLAAAGFATALYSTFCNEDRRLFYAVWYSLGIGIVTAAGAVAGALPALVNAPGRLSEGRAGLPHPGTG
ncbi:MAG: NrsF family protein [Defluviimonas denitrificans]